jgi:DNA-directed RNA polymerase subunit RPC12/RpoP/uncharacterized membrane protein YeaQ/YmgE (transglycosylase-associated protein family)
MNSFITLSCPNCGGKLQITTEIDRFACAHCGQEHIVKRGAGTISLHPVIEGLDKVQHGVDKTSSELAIKRLTGEINSLIDQKERAKGSWYGSNYGWGCFLIFIFGILTVMCYMTGDGFSIASLFLAVVTAIIAILVFRYLNRMKENEEKKWKKSDKQISDKISELHYHQNIVSKF